MKKLLLVTILLLSTLFSFAQVPANDNCSTATNLGTLPTPAACPSGVGANVNVTNQTNINATAPSPYTTLLGCQTGGNQPGPALDVWYSFVASGNQVNINITPGTAPVLQSPAITLWTGTCGSLVGFNCDNNGTAGGNNSVLFQPTTPGQTYYIQVSGMNAASSGNFNMTVSASNDCNNCLQIGNLTVSPAPVGGTYPPNTTVTFCYNITSYTQVSVNWLHGLTYTFGCGWDLTTLTATPPPSCSGNGYWAWWNTWTSSANASVWGPGFAYDNNTTPGNPGNNFGDNCATPNWNFCITLKTKPTCTPGCTNLNMTINTSGDGESGSWGSVACTGDPNVQFAASMSCCTATAVGVNPTCNGGTNGSATATPGPTGVGPFTYSWNSSPVQTTQTATNLPAGTYTVTITDFNGCVSTATVTLTNPPAMTAPITSTNVTCNGGTNGSATVNPTGSVGPYTYSWNSIPVQTTQTATNLPAGTYIVTVTSATGCIKTNTVTITQPTPITVTTTTLNATCSLLNGSATANPVGGVGPYTYSWNSTPIQTTQTASGLGAGSYIVTVTGVGGCTATATATVTSTGSITSTTTGTNVSCFGGTNGSATATPLGGGPYTYSWNSTPVQTTQTATNLPAGTYTVTVNSSGCITTSTIVITQPTLLNATSTQVNVTCNGGTNGSATANPTGGTSPYTYLWSNGQTTQTAINLVAGVYSCTITDTNGCTKVISVTITQPTAITVTTTQVNTTCGLPNGSATANPVGGVGPYTYSWNSIPVQTTQTATGLLAGSYVVTVTGVGGCTVTSNVTILNTGAATVTIPTHINVSCFGGTNGSATSNVVGGVGPFTYSWNSVPVQTTPNATNLPAGTYTLTVTGSNGCSSTATVVITQPTQLSSSITTTNVSCFGGTNGSATSSPSGGVGPYTYSWNSVPVQTTQTATNLPLGTYNCTVTDVNGCQIVVSANITQPSQLTLALGTQTNISCFGGNNGAITVVAGGGTGVYLYSLNAGPNQLSPIFSSLTAGTYTIKVTDANGCNTTITVILTQPTALSITGSITNVTCFGSCNGQLLSNVSGGVSPYTYLWSNGQTTNPATGLCAGSYSVVSTDANGCQVVQTGMVVSQPNVLGVTVNATPSSICVGQTSNLTSNIVGGTAPYTYLWSNGGTTSNISVSPVVTTSYTVTITDANGCITTGSVTVTVNPVLTISASATPTSICSGQSSTLSANAAGGDGGPYTFVWTPGGSGQTINVTPVTTTVYTVSVSDGCSPSVSTTVTVTVNPSPIIAFSTTPLSGCEPLTVTYTNLTPSAANCVWTINGVPFNSCVVTQTFPVQGTYNSFLTVTDVNGCSATSPTVVANVYPIPTAAFNANPTITDILNPSIVFNNTSSVGSYSWNFGDGNTSNVSFPTHVYGDTGTYQIQLIVTTSHGCIDTAYGTIHIDDIFTVYVPNAFTPNSDGHNDTFVPVVNGAEKFTFWIYDRWGEMIYQSDGGAPWDATYKGREVQQDVYVWKLIVIDKRKIKHEYIGHVTIIK